MIIDFHVHIFPPKVRDNLSYYFEREPYFQQLYSSPRARLATAEEVIASMDEAGIDRCVVLNFGWSSHQMCVETNDYILEAAVRYPQRLVPFCTVQPRQGQEALAEIGRCAQAGARGLGEFNPDGQGFDLADLDLMRPVVRAALEAGLIFQSHASEPVGHLYRGKGQTTPHIVYSFIRAFPELPLVFCHWGGGLPFYGLMPEVAQALGKVYFDTAASPLLYRDEVFRHVAEIVGVGKVLFGSDFPLLNQRKFVERIRALDLPEEDKAKILGQNAAALLSLAGGAG